MKNTLLAEAMSISGQEKFDLNQLENELRLVEKSIRETNKYNSEEAEIVVEARYLLQNPCDENNHKLNYLLIPEQLLPYQDEYWGGINLFADIAMEEFG